MTRNGDRHKGHGILVRVTPEQRDRLLAISERDGRAVAWLTRDAITAYIAADGDGAA